MIGRSESWGEILAKLIKSRLPKEAARGTGRHEAEDESRWMEHAVAEPGADPAEAIQETYKGDKEKDQELVPVESPAVQTVEKEHEMAPEEAPERVEIIKQILEMRRSKESPEKVEELISKLNTLYASALVLFVRRAEGEGPAPEEVAKIKEGLVNNAATYADEASSIFYQDMDTMDKVKDIVLRESMNERDKTGSIRKDFDGEQLYLQYPMFRGIVDEIANRMFEQNRDLHELFDKYRLDQDFIGVFKKAFIPHARKFPIDFATEVMQSPEYENDFMQYNEPLPGEDIARSKGGFDRLMNSLGKIYRRWKNDNKEILHAYRDDAIRKVLKYIETISTGEPSSSEVDKLLEDLKPNKNVLGQWVDEILSTELEAGDGSLSSSIKEELAQMGKDFNLSPQQAEYIKSELSNMLMADLEWMWNRIIEETTGAAGLYSKIKQ